VKIESKILLYDTLDHSKKKSRNENILEPIACVFRIHVSLNHNSEDCELRLEVCGGLSIVLSQGPLLNRTEHPCFSSVMQGLSVRLVTVVAVPILVLGAALMMIMVVVLFPSFLFHLSHDLSVTFTFHNYASFLKLEFFG